LARQTREPAAHQRVLKGRLHKVEVTAMFIDGIDVGEGWRQASA
jgi:hypothetical protein